MQDEIIKKINDSVQDLIELKNAEIEQATRNITTITQLESYLTDSGQSFIGLAAEMGYEVVKTASESDIDLSKNDDTVKKLDIDLSGKEVKELDIDLSGKLDFANLTKAEILVKIQEIDSDYNINIDKTSKDDLIAELQLKTEDLQNTK